MRCSVYEPPVWPQDHTNYVVPYFLITLGPYSRGPEGLRILSCGRRPRKRIWSAGSHQWKISMYLGVRNILWNPSVENPNIFLDVSPDKPTEMNCIPLTFQLCHLIFWFKKWQHCNKSHTPSYTQNHCHLHTPNLHTASLKTDLINLMELQSTFCNRLTD